MHSIRKIVVAALAVVPLFAHAQPPYAISGLHTELLFTEAVALAEQLGGICQIIAARRKDSGSSAECKFSPCVQRDQAGACSQQDTDKRGLVIAAQPVIAVSLEAPSDSSPLTRIIFLHDGDTAVIATSLIDEFGSPYSGGAAGESWSHSRRLHWRQGDYHMALLDERKLIILGVDRAPEKAEPAGS